MSYEILLFPRTPGQDWDEVLAADEADGPEMDLVTLNRGVATFRRIEARLREQLTEPVRTWVAEELDGDILGELQSRDSGLRVDLYDQSASVSIPYGGPDAPAHDLARAAVEIVAAETGYAPYDPQVGATFEGHFDDAAGQASLSRPTDGDDLWADQAPGDTGPEGTAGDAADDAVGDTPLEGRVVGDGESAGGEQDGPLDPRAERQRLLQERRQQLEERRRDPASLRRRGWFYLIFGVLLTAMGTLRLADGDSSLLTWLFLGVGVFELAGGWFMFGQSKLIAAQKQAEEGQAPGTQDDGPDTGVQQH